MDKTANRIATILFIIVILAFGTGTALKVRGSVVDIVKNEAIADIPDLIESKLTDDFKSRNNWISLNGLFQRIIGVSIIRDAGDYDIYKLANGQLAYDYPDCDMMYAVQEVSSLCEYVQDSGATFMYVQLPCKVYSDELMPPGTHSYGYKDADELLEGIRKNGVPILDLREEMEKESLNTSDLFFNTDHHWKPSTGLWAAHKIADALAGSVEGYTFDAGLYDINNYDAEKYEDWFLGSLGRRTGVYFGGVDDFEVIIPKFKTDFHLYTESQAADGKQKNKDGSFKKALMKLSYVEEKDYFSPMTYFTYMGNEYRLATVTNKKTDNHKKILLLRDSFSCTMLPYLSLSTVEITAIDMRYHSEFKIKEYIRDNDFDAVLVAYNPSMFREEGAFDFDR